MSKVTILQIKVYRKTVTIQDLIYNTVNSFCFWEHSTLKIVHSIELIGEY